MSDPWSLYDELIDAIPSDLTVTAGTIGQRWCRVLSSAGGLGMGLAFSERSRPPLFTGTSYIGARLREVAALVKSWNFAEAGLGLAALNAWYAAPDTARRNGYTLSPEPTWQQAFHPYAEAVADKTVSVIGHFPFAPEPLARAKRLHVLERHPHPGDYPDPACEYLLPESDYVFISGSAFINKTAPRLLELSHSATTVFIGPSTPLSPVLFDYGADTVTGFLATEPAALFDTLGTVSLAGMYDHGRRVQQHRPRP